MINKKRNRDEKGRFVKICLNEKEIIRLYVEEKRKIKQIGKIFNCSYTPIYNILKINSINTSRKGRPLSGEHKKNLMGSHKGIFGYKFPKGHKTNIGKKQSEETKQKHSESSIKWHQENKDTEEYKQRNKKIRKSKKDKTWEEIYGEEIAKEMRIKRSSNLKGENSPTFNNWSSLEPYGREFNNQFKNLIRLRDNFCCLNCGISEPKHVLITGDKLYVHHIDYIKENTFLKNCCSLCVRCHSLTNFNREHWTKFFQYLLSERYGYQYSENGEIILNLNKEENAQKE